MSDHRDTRKRNSILKNEYIQLLLRILFLLFVFWLLFSQVFLIERVNGQEMFPAIKDGDLALAYRLQKDYSKNDVLVYTVDGETHVGRVAAVENDVVTLDDSGSLSVNGTVQSGEILYPTYAKEELEYPYRVPENHIFILGDYRTQAEDSRDFGPIPLEDVKGKIITILRRRGL